MALALMVFCRRAGGWLGVFRHACSVPRVYIMHIALPHLPLFVPATMDRNSDMLSVVPAASI